MIKLTLGTNTSRKEIIVEETKTVKELLVENDIPLGVGTISLNGVPLTTTEINSTLKQLDVQDRAFLVSVVKSDNAR